jgi:hypothetical protein
MTKPMITRIWIIGLIVLAIGLIVGGIGLGLMLAYGGHFTARANGSGYDFTPTINAFFWTTVGLMTGGFAVAAGGGIAQLAAWIGAVINTYQIQDKTWFIVLLVGGFLSLGFALFGFATMVAYLIAGPDGKGIAPPQGIPSAPPPATLAPNL